VRILTRCLYNQGILSRHFRDRSFICPLFNSNFTNRQFFRELFTKSPANPDGEPINIDHWESRPANNTTKPCANSENINIYHPTGTENTASNELAANHRQTNMQALPLNVEWTHTGTSTRSTTPLLNANTSRGEWRSRSAHKAGRWTLFQKYSVCML
jgi:hypothetical protein